MLIFKGSSYFDKLNVLELISRTQVDFESNILMNYDSCVFSKYKLLLVLVHKYFVLKINLDCQDGLRYFYNHKTCILIEKLTFKHLSYIMLSK